MNKNVEIKWQIPEIEPQYVLEYQESKQDVQYEIKDLIQIIKKTIEREQRDARFNLTKGDYKGFN